MTFTQLVAKIEAHHMTFTDLVQKINQNERDRVKETRRYNAMVRMNGESISGRRVIKKVGGMWHVGSSKRFFTFDAAEQDAFYHGHTLVMN